MVMLLAAMQATASQWQPLSSQPASGRGLEASFGYNDAVYACVESVSGTGQSTILKSTDLGQTWDSVLSAPGLCAVKAVPNSNHVYAATRAGIYRSSDGGGSWDWRPIGNQGERRIDVVAVDPNYPDTVYAGEGRFAEPNHINLLFKTTDGGVNWADVSPPNLGGASITDVIVQPGYPDTVIITSRGGGGAQNLVTFTSTDGGASWFYSSPVGGASFTSLAINSAYPNLVCAGDSDGSHCKIAVSTDWGCRFGEAPTGTGYTWYATSVAADPTNPNVVYVSTPGQGVYKSTDLGFSWFPMNSGMSLTNMDWTRITTSLPSSHCLFAGERTAGFYRFDFNPYHSWIQVARWTPCDSIQRVAVGTPGLHIWTLSNRGVVATSPNGGVNWTSTDTAHRSALLLQPSATGDTVLHTGQTVTGMSIQCSTDRGYTWSTRYAGAGEINGLACAQSNASYIYAVGNSGADYKVLRSTDIGWSWNSTLPIAYSLNCVAVDRNYPAIIYVGCLNGDFAQSTDGGTNFDWRAPVSSSPVNVLAVKPGPSSTSIYAGTPQGVFRTTNQGTSWSQPSLQFDVKDLAVDPQNPDRLWASATDLSGVDHIYASFDDAASWAEMSEGLPAGVQTNGLCLKAGTTPQDPCSLYIATSVGVYRRELTFLASRNPNATAPNSGRKIVREPNTQNFHIVYTSTDSIFYSYSGDGGQTWSAAEFIDRGFSPAVVLNPPQSMIGYVPWVAYVKNNSTVWRAIRLAPSLWNFAQVFAGSAATQVGGLALASASLSMLDPMAYVTYSVTDPGSPPQHRINFNTFSRIWVSPPETVYNSGSADSKDPSIAVTPGDIIHVCWNRAQGARQTIAYSKKQTGTQWQGPFLVSTNGPVISEPASHPSVEAYGDKVYCVWRGPNSDGSFPGDIWQSWSNVQPTGWSFPNNVSTSSNQESDNPEMSTDFVTVWNEQQQPGSPNSDIWAKFALESNPRPIFTSPLPSALPHVAGYWALGQRYLPHEHNLD
jgi:photosystem II stability/assembly factor-like uncharacterized protein